LIIDHSFTDDLHLQSTSQVIYLFIQAISIVPFLVHNYSEALPTQHGYCVGVSRWSATGNSERRTCSRPVWRLERDSTFRTKGDESTNEPPRPTI